jgi:hypothetical protein
LFSKDDNCDGLPLDLFQLEGRQLEELEELRQKLVKQFDARQASAAREIEVHLLQQAKERERSQHAAVMQEGKRRRHIEQYQEQELRQLHKQQKKDKKNKDDMRKVTVNLFFVVFIEPCQSLVFTTSTCSVTGLHTGSEYSCYTNLSPHLLPSVVQLLQEVSQDISPCSTN